MHVDIHININVCCRFLHFDCVIGVTKTVTRTDIWSLVNNHLTKTYHINCNSQQNLPCENSKQMGHRPYGTYLSQKVFVSKLLNIIIILKEEK